MKGFLCFVGIYAGIVLPLIALVWIACAAIGHRRRMREIRELATPPYPYCGGEEYVSTGGCDMKWAECVCLQARERIERSRRATFLRR